ncbi:MAG: DMT family transporter [Candidatus Micrarchaeota archaeon]
MIQSIKAYGFALLSVMLWATAAAVSKLLLGKGLNALQLLLFTSFFATVSLVLVAASNGKLKLVKHFSVKEWIQLGAIGAIGIFLYHICYFGSLQYLPAQETTIINYLWPLMTVLIAIPLLHESFSIRKLGATVLSLAGVWIVVSNGNIFSFRFDNAFGVALAFSGAVLYGLFAVLGKKSKIDKTSSMLAYCAVTFALSLISVPVFSRIPAISLLQLIGTAWLGICIGIGFWLWFLALHYGDTAKISNLAYLVPFISLVFVYVLLAEEIMWFSIAGLVLIVAGIFAQTWPKPDFKRQ